MTTPQIRTDLGQTNVTQANVLGIIFFILGAPHLYGALKRSSTRSGGMFTPARYLIMAMLAALLAGIVEFSVWW